MLMYLIIVPVLLICLALIICIHDMTHIKVRHYTLSDQKVQRDIRFVLLADLHNHMFSEKNRKLIEAIDREKPDAVLIAGDLITRERKDYFEGAVSLLEGLASKYPVYYAPGNHETKLEACQELFGDSFERYKKELDRLKLHLMHNEKLYLKQENIAIYGLELPIYSFIRFSPGFCSDKMLQELLGEPDSKEFNLLIAHTPEHFLKYANWGADLVVSGHQHGGIIRLPFVGGVISTAGKLFPKYDGGLFSKDRSRMIISRGLGTHTIPVRFNNPCELVVLDLKGDVSNGVRSKAAGF